MEAKWKVAGALSLIVLFASKISAQVKTVVWSLNDPAHSDVWTEPETGQRLNRIQADGVSIAHELMSANKHGVFLIFFITNSTTRSIRFRFSDIGGVVASPGFENLSLSPLKSYSSFLKPEAMQEQQAYMTNPLQPIDLGPNASDFVRVLFDRPRIKPDQFRELRFRIIIDDTEYIFPDHFGATQALPQPNTLQPSASSASSQIPCAPAVLPAGTVPSEQLNVISFAIADEKGGVHPGMMGWTTNWIGKNAKKFPNVLFQQGCPVHGAQNYLIVFSASARVLSGFDPVVTTSTSTDTTPVSGSGTVTDNNGSMWNYTFNGTVTTTTTTTTQENVPYTIQSNTLYATAYDEHGVIVSQRWHVYNTKQGGDAANSAGYNLAGALFAINSRGSLLNGVVKDIVGKKSK